MQFDSWLDGLGRDSPLARYLSEGQNEVKGWLNPVDAQLIASIGNLQTEHDIGGGVGEIGVYHGKLFIILYLLRNPYEKAFCIDVFEHQELNLDQSGGLVSPATFRDNVVRHAGSFDVHVMSRSSEQVAADEILSAVGPVRLFSVDGGHTAELTLNDLTLAEQSLDQAGVVVLDDYFNRMWPAVSNGCNQFFQRTNRLAPFAISVNKVFFSCAERAEFYREGLREASSLPVRKSSVFLGHPVDIYPAPHQM
jgi:hypothetical protein